MFSGNNLFVSSLAKQSKFKGVLFINPSTISNNSCICFFDSTTLQFKRTYISILRELKDNDGVRSQRIRVGRGIGSGKGKTSGKGHKGQKARNGRHLPLNFEGGQTPLIRRFPKFGFINRFKMDYTELNLGQLQYHINRGRLDITQPIKMNHLINNGIVSSIKDGVKIIGGGADYFNSKINIEVSRISKSAKEAIERHGGEVKSVYYSKLSLRALLHPEKFKQIPKMASPPPRLWRFYPEQAAQYERNLPALQLMLKKQEEQQQQQQQQR